MSIFDDLAQLDWNDLSPPNLVEIGIKLTALESEFVEKGLVLPDGYDGAEAIMDKAIMDKAIMDEVDFNSISGFYQECVDILKELGPQIEAEKLLEVFQPIIEAVKPQAEEKKEISDEDGSLVLELQNDEDLDSLRTFNSESVENIDNLDDKLPSLVKKSDDITLLNNLFRGYHTIKGAAGFFGLEPISQVTHEMENVLDRARQGKVIVDDEVIALMSRGNAWIKKHFQRLDALLEDTVAPLEVTLTIDNFAPIYYSCKAILSRSVVDVEMVTSSEESSEKDSSIRISQEYLDQFLDEIGGLINLAHIFNHSIALLEKSKMERSEIQMFKDNFGSLEDRSQKLQNNLMMLRRVKLETIFKKIPKIIYKLGQTVGKEVEVICEGGDVEIDRSMLDNLEEPLVHILRNSMDHGFEENDDRESLGKSYSGTLRIVAEDKGNVINLKISDDGRGVNGDIVSNIALEKGLFTPEQIDLMSYKQKQELIFMAGFSTKEQTSEISGRGVGMDVVRTKILETGGTLEMASELGQGTNIMIDLPKSATLATRSILRVRVSDSWFGFPMDKIEYLSSRDIHQKLPILEKGIEAFPYRDQMLSIISLGDVFGIEKQEGKKERCFIIMKDKGQKFVVEVDELDEFEIQVIQELLKGHFDKGPFEGASVLGDGSICLMLSVEKVLDSAKIRVDAEERIGSAIQINQSTYELTNTLVFKPSLENLMISVDMSSVYRIDNFVETSLSVIKRRRVYNSIHGLLQYYEFSDFGIGESLGEGELPETVLIINICERPLAFGVAKIIDMYSGSLNYIGELNLPGLCQSWSYNEKLVGVVDLKYIESFFQKAVLNKNLPKLTG